MEIKNFCANLVNQISTEGNLLLDLDNSCDDIHDLGYDILRSWLCGWPRPASVPDHIEPRRLSWCVNPSGRAADDRGQYG